MKEKNPKSENYIIREAENIIKDYLKQREFRDTKKYCDLKEKYDRTRILIGVLLIINIVLAFMCIVKK